MSATTAGRAAATALSVRSAGRPSVVAGAATATPTRGAARPCGPACPQAAAAAHPWPPSSAPPRGRRPPPTKRRCVRSSRARRPLEGWTAPPAPRGRRRLGRGTRPRTVGDALVRRAGAPAAGHTAGASAAEGTPAQGLVLGSQPNVATPPTMHGAPMPPAAASQPKAAASPPCAVGSRPPVPALPPRMVHQRLPTGSASPARVRGSPPSGCAAPPRRMAPA